jgi:ParB family chromosome partitioning protein
MPTQFADLALESLELPAADLRRAVPQASLEELAASIRTQGILEPLVVATTPAPGRYRIVAGGRRFRAAKLAGLTSVPAVIRTFSPAEELEARLVENLQREDLSLLEKARGYFDYLKATNTTAKALAERLGVTSGHVSQVLSVLKLPAEVRELIGEAGLSVAYARELARLADVPKVATAYARNLRQDLKYSGLPPVAEVKAQVDRELEEVELEARHKAEEAARAQAEAALAKATKAGDAKTAAKLKAELAAPPRSREEVARAKARAKMGKLTRGAKAAAAIVAKRYAGEALELAKAFKVPDKLLGALVEALTLDYHADTPAGFGLDPVLEVLTGQISLHLPGRWERPAKGAPPIAVQGPDAADATARRAYLGLWAWYLTRAGAARAELSRMAEMAAKVKRGKK